LYTFKADIGLLYIRMGFHTWGKIGEGVVLYWPLTNLYFLWKILTYVPSLRLFCH